MFDKEILSQDFFDIYKVEKGDSLYKIAKEYNINPTLLSSLNGLNIDDYIYPDQEILVPKKGYLYYITVDGDTIDLVSDKFSLNIDEILSENTIYLLPGQLLIHKK